MTHSAVAGRVGGWEEDNGSLQVFLELTHEMPRSGCVLVYRNTQGITIVHLSLQIFV